QVFLRVTSTLNLAVFRDHFGLEDLVGEMKKRSPALSFGPLQPDGQIAVEGSFPELRMLREFLLLKAKSPSEQEKRDGKPHQALRRKQQERRSSVRDAHREKHVVVLDTDIYHYMRCFRSRIFQGTDVAISGVTDGDITTVCIEGAGSKAAHAVRVAKQAIEDRSVEFQKVLRKERLCFKGHSRAERQRYKQLCARLSPSYPEVLILPYDTHFDIIGTSRDVFAFAEEVRR
ncbi:RBM43 protein, partial [Sitta europaea]|nr:RBM43 protein [Sitta europaea]